MEIDDDIGGAGGGDSGGEGGSVASGGSGDGASGGGGDGEDCGGDGGTCFKQSCHSSPNLSRDSGFLALFFSFSFFPFSEFALSIC